MKQKGEVQYVFYNYIHYMLVEKYREDKIISTKDAMKFLFEWRIPEKIRPIIIKELEKLKLTERINKKTIKLNPSSFDTEDLRKFYEGVGIY